MPPLGVRASKTRPLGGTGIAIVSSRAALVLLDFQTSVVESHEVEGAKALSAAGAAVNIARQARIPIIFVVVQFRPGHPEVTDTNATFVGLRKASALLEADKGAQLHPALARRADEPVVVKRRVGAFCGTDLEVLLRAMDARHLVLSGIATSGVVLSTLRVAADLDYRLTVLRDACADRDGEVHSVLLEKVFVRQAVVVDTREWSSALGT
jgi:nicotinamidase-related amidase